MKLYSNAMSPYGRKVMVVVRELGLLERIEMVDAQPRLRPEEVAPVNPIGKIPVLVLDDGSVLRDSPVIAEFLCDGFGGGALLPSGPGRWPVLTDVADGDGAIEAAILVRNERLRPAERQSDEFIAWNLAKVSRSLDHWEACADRFAGRYDLGTIALGCALAYVPRRLPEFEGLRRHPGLVRLYDELTRRPAFAATEPS